MWIQNVRAGGVTSLAFSLDGRTLYTLDGGGWVTAWDVATHAARPLCVGAWSSPFNPRGLSYLADGRLLIRTETFFLLSNTGEVLKSPAPPELGHYVHAQVRPDGRVYYGGFSHSVLVWDLLTGAPRPGFTVPAVAGPGANVRSFDLSPDGRAAAITFSSDHPAVVFEVAEDGVLRNPTQVADFKPARYAQFSPDGGTLVVITRYSDVWSSWDVRTQTPRAANIGCASADHLLAFHPTAPLFAALNWDRDLTLFSLETGESLRTLDFALGRDVRCAAFSPDGLTCAVGGSNKQFAVFDVDV